MTTHKKGEFDTCNPNSPRKGGEGRNSLYTKYNKIISYTEWNDCREEEIDIPNLNSLRE